MFRFPRTHATLASNWCRRLNARALMVDYRLAPEHRYPAAPDDCHDAYRWLLESGADPRNIVIAGDSAGANLVLVTLQCIRDAGEPLPACAVAISPVTDFTLSSPSLSANATRDPMLTLAALVRLRSLYAPPEAVLEPAVSPLFGNWSRLPPILFQAGDDEMLRDDALRAAARASAAGVAIEAEIWAHMAHVWHVMGLPQSEAASAHVVEFIRRRTGWT
jgi:acetyl esterase/lipase